MSVTRMTRRHYLSELARETQRASSPKRKYTIERPLRRLVWIHTADLVLPYNWLALCESLVAFRRASNCSCASLSVRSTPSLSSMACGHLRASYRWFILVIAISTTWDGAHGIGGFFERMFAPRVMRAIYTDELSRLDAYARDHAA